MAVAGYNGLVMTHFWHPNHFIAWPRMSPNEHICNYESAHISSPSIRRESYRVKLLVADIPRNILRRAAGTLDTDPGVLGLSTDLAVSARRDDLLVAIAELLDGILHRWVLGSAGPLAPVACVGFGFAIADIFRWLSCGHGVWGGIDGGDEARQEGDGEGELHVFCAVVKMCES